ncbi:MAG: DUF4382 domain-containing protein [Flavobacteriaceae bacterium]|nr:DUF4382 domain-containing protein [Flavobacteriaceae bacterium]
MKVNKNMKVKSFILSLMLVAAFTLGSCSKNDEGTSSIKINLVDAPGDYEKVLVNIIDVQYNRTGEDNGWVSFDGFVRPNTNDPQNRVDLTELIAGNSLVLTNEDVTSGSLKHIRLVLGDGNAVVFKGDTKEVPLATPSALQSGLKLQIDTELQAGFSYTFVLDWDVQKSIVEAGNSGAYNLKPVIRVIAEVNSGIIEGRLADANETENNPMPIADAVVTVYKESDTTFQTAVSSTYTNNEGKFSLQGLPKGNYKLKIEKDGFVSYTSSTAISVEVGKKTTVDTILLTKTS